VSAIWNASGHRHSDLLVHVVDAPISTLDQHLGEDEFLRAEDDSVGAFYTHDRFVIIVVYTQHFLLL
jgi:hypothetical protein